MKPAATVFSAQSGSVVGLRAEDFRLRRLMVVDGYPNTGLPHLAIEQSQRGPLLTER